MVTTTKSRYSPIWEKLKIDGTVSLVAAPLLHRRIIKAVLKRKDLDTAYKFIQSEAGYTCRIEYKIRGTTITFYLRKQVTLYNL